MMLWEQGFYDQALVQLERAIALIEATPTIARRLAADTIANTGLIYRGLKDYARAREHYERALAIYVEILGPDDVAIAGSHNNIAILLHFEGHIEQAERRLEQAAAIKERALGPNHPELGDTLVNLGRTRGTLGKYEHALADLNRGLGISEHALGRDSPRQAPIHTRIAIIHAAAGDHAAAITAFERAIALIERDEGDWTKQLAATRLAFAGTLWDASVVAGRDRPRARGLVEQAREGYVAIDDLTHVESCDRWLAEHR
jgi:tetratricopeptide (TPR) repeat protein